MTDDSCLIFGQFGITECILSVALLEDAFVANSFGHNEAERAVFENRGVIFGFSKYQSLWLPRTTIQDLALRSSISQSGLTARIHLEGMVLRTLHVCLNVRYCFLNMRSQTPWSMGP